MNTEQPATPEPPRARNLVGYSPELNPNFRNPKFWTDEKIADAIVKAHGVISEAVRILSRAYGRPAHRQTISELINANPRLRALCDQSFSMLGDTLESRVYYRALEQNDQKDQHFLLRTKFKDRGYSTSSQIGGTGGGPIQIETDGLSDAEFESLSEDERAIVIDAERIRIAARDRRIAETLALPAK